MPDLHKLFAEYPALDPEDGTALPAEGSLIRRVLTLPEGSSATFQAATSNTEGARTLFPVTITVTKIGGQSRRVKLTATPPGGDESSRIQSSVITPVVRTDGRGRFMAKAPDLGVDGSFYSLTEAVTVQRMLNTLMGLAQGIATDLEAEKDEAFEPVLAAARKQWEATAPAREAKQAFDTAVNARNARIRAALEPLVSRMIRVQSQSHPTRTTGWLRTVADDHLEVQLPRRSRRERSTRYWHLLEVQIADQSGAWTPVPIPTPVRKSDYPELQGTGA